MNFYMDLKNSNNLARIFILLFLILSTIEGIIHIPIIRVLIVPSLVCIIIFVRKYLKSSKKFLEYIDEFIIVHSAKELLELFNEADIKYEKLEESLMVVLPDLVIEIKNIEDDESRKVNIVYSLKGRGIK